MTKHSRPSQSKRTSVKHIHTHHPPTTAHSARRAHIRTGWALLIIGCWVAVGLITGLALLHFTRHASREAVTIKVLKTAYDANGHEPFLPGTDYKFVLVDVDITNTTDQTFNLAPVVQSYLTDTEGARYDMAPAIIAHPLAAGRLASNVHTQGTLSYAVPLNAKNLTFHFDADSPQHLRYRQRLPNESR